MTYLVSSAATSNSSIAIDYLPSKEAISLWDDLLSLRDRIVSREELASEYAVMSAKQILSETHAKAQQFQVLRNTVAIKSLLGSSSFSPESSTASPGSNRDFDQSSLSDLARQRMRMVESFQRSVLSQEQGVRGKDLLDMALQNSLSEEEVQALNDQAETAAQEGAEFDFDTREAER